MNMPNKPLLDRALYKKIKAMDRETMDNFIQNIYQTGKDDVHATEVDFDKLREDISKINGIGESRLNEIMAVIESHIGADSE
jgi:hypothetical protein